MKNKYKSKKKLLCGTLLAGCALFGAGSVSAAETGGSEQAQEFTLSPVLITATRYEKQDLDVGASVQVVTAQDIENAGAQSAQDMLRYIPGFENVTYGNKGSSMGNMASKTLTRGVGGGALVLVNGVPYKMRAVYDLSDIQAANIERIEIVRGSGGAVLYGSDAMTGVVNIITKKKRENYFTGGIGNHEGRKAGVSFQSSKLGAYYGYDSFGDIFAFRSSSPNGVWHGPMHRDLRVNYQFDEHIDVEYSHAANRLWYKANRAAAALTGYDVARNHGQINYKNKNLSAHVYYMDRDRDQFNQNGFSNNELSENYGGNIQYFWDLKKGRLLAGGDYMNANYRSQARYDYSRQEYSAFLQYEHNFDDKNTFIIGGRETWTSGDQVNYDNFSFQTQYIHKLKNNESVYFNLGTSFQLPELHNIYGEIDGIADRGLKPAKGKSVEIGYKKDFRRSSLRTALFWQEITDNITLEDWEPRIYVNNDLKNYGLEVSYDYQINKHLTYGTGVSFSNPRTSYNGGPYLKEYAGFQWSNRIGVTYGKLRANLSVSYLANRYRARNESSTTEQKIKPALATNLNISYKASKQHEFTLSFDNIFSRHDISYTSPADSSGVYYALPYTYMLSYKFFF